MFFIFHAMLILTPMTGARAPNAVRKESLFIDRAITAVSVRQVACYLAIKSLVLPPELARQSLYLCRGKSGLHRAKRQVIPGGREPTESAAENIPPNHRQVMVRVKRCGKSAPRRWQHRVAG